MRKYSYLMLLLVILFPLNSNSTTKNEKKSSVISIKTPVRAKGQTDVIELRCAPIDTVRIAVIGLGNRGSEAINRLSYISTAKIVAICDVNKDYIRRAQDTIQARGHSKASEYSGANDWKEICKRSDIDLVYVCTHWELHTPIALLAMKSGKHVAVEVPAALTIDECWALVNTSEITRKHCMMLENCNYDFFEMATLNMAQKGLFGEIMHGEGAYIQDLRELNFSPTYYWNMWRLEEHKKNNGNLYPTHGLGPIAHAMNIHRGDKMDFLVSVSTNQVGMTEYAKSKFGVNSPEAKTNYVNGDMSTTIIRTSRGKSILIQHDVTSPRPYSRLHTLSGTKGFAQKYPVEGLAFSPASHEFLSPEARDKILLEYEHPIVTEIGKMAKKVGGHGGMDFIMDYRLIYCLNHGLPLDQDVYDAAEWSSIVHLSRISVENNSASVQIPDFTRGAWNKVKTVTYFK